MGYISDSALIETFIRLRRLNVQYRLGIIVESNFLGRVDSLHIFGPII